MSLKQELHQLIDMLPEGRTDEARVLLIALLARHHSEQKEYVSDADSAIWLDEGATTLSERLAAIEADVSPEDLAAWVAALEQNAKHCQFVPGMGFVPVS